jgi:hypothetical protein
MLITGLAGMTPEDLNLETMQLLLHFFSVEELIDDLKLVDLSIRELTILKATLLQEMAAQVARQSGVRDAVRARVLRISKRMREQPHA